MLDNLEADHDGQVLQTDTANSYFEGTQGASRTGDVEAHDHSGLCNNFWYDMRSNAEKYQD